MVEAEDGKMFREELRQARCGRAEVLKETIKVFGVSSGWRKEEVQESGKVREMKKVDLPVFQEARCKAKREVSKQRVKAHSELCVRLDTKKGQKDSYSWHRAGKDVQKDLG